VRYRTFSLVLISQVHFGYNLLITHGVETK
jgi:hypothetical protein